MIEINTSLIKNLIKEQFPKWADLEIKPVAKSGHDNRTFHLGKTMTVRLPSAKGYASQVEKEITWLPYLQKYLDMPISSPIEKGVAGCGYPYSWSVNKYIKGETLTKQNVDSLEQLALDLAEFLSKLQAIDATKGPQAGIHNYYRGGNLSFYHDETIAALDKLKDILPTAELYTIWKQALDSFDDNLKVWVHGDVAPGNLLVQDGKLAAVIDFGVLGVGDPACDYAMAWTFFDSNSRKIFLQGLDHAMINRARGWALWKALITYHDSQLERADNAKTTINEILQENRIKN